MDKIWSVDLNILVIKELLLLQRSAIENLDKMVIIFLTLSLSLAEHLESFASSPSS